MAYELLGEIFAVVAILFSVVWVVLGYRGMKLASLILGRGREDRAVEVLRERYGRGEISTEEFEERMRKLKASPPP